MLGLETLSRRLLQVLLLSNISRILWQISLLVKLLTYLCDLWPQNNHWRPIVQGHFWKHEPGDELQTDDRVINQLLARFLYRRHGRRLDGLWRTEQKKRNLDPLVYQASTSNIGKWLKKAKTNKQTEHKQQYKTKIPFGGGGGGGHGRWNTRRRQWSWVGGTPIVCKQCSAPPTLLSVSGFRHPWEGGGGWGEEHLPSMLPGFHHCVDLTFTRSSPSDLVPIPTCTLKRAEGVVARGVVATDVVLLLALVTIWRRGALKGNKQVFCLSFILRVCLHFIWWVKCTALKPLSHSSEHLIPQIANHCNGIHTD